MRRFTLSALAAAVLAVAAPTTALAAHPADSGGEALAPPPHVITTPLDGVPMTETYDGGGGLPYLGSKTSYNAGDWESVLETYHDSGVYLEQIAKVDSVAQRWVVRASHGKGHKRGFDRGRGQARAHHARSHARKPALVLDIDETTLSNYSAIDADHFTYGSNSRSEADNEVGTAIAPTKALYDAAQSRGVTVFFITGRGEAQRAHTEHNLQTQGFTGYKQLYLKPAGSTLSTVQYKTGARKDIESQGYRIVANVGDQYSDLAGGHAERDFKLANPFYFLP